MKKILRPTSETLFWENESGCFAARPSTSQRARLNRLGYRVLTLCDGQRDLQEVCRRIATESGQNLARVERDVLGFADQMRRLGFVETAAESPDSVGPAPPLRNVYLSLTSRCNLSCRFCYASAGKPLANELQAREWLSLLEQIARLAEEQGQPVRVTLTGGEPLLSPAFRAVARRAAQLGLTLELYTNGTRLTPRTADFLATLPWSYIGVSLDGGRARTHDALRGKPGSFQRARAGLARLVERDLAAAWQMVVCRPNLKELPLVVRQVRRMGLGRLQLGSLDALGSAAQPKVRDQLSLRLEEELELREFIAEINLDPDAGVRIGRFDSCRREDPNPFQLGLCGLDRLCHVTPSGSVTLCPALWDPPFAVGDIRRTPLDQLWRESRRWAPVRGKTLAQLDSCGSCGLRALCRGGCRANAFLQSGSLTGCESRRREVLQALVSGNRSEKR